MHSKAILIRMRKAHPLFRLADSDQVRKAVSFLDDQLGLKVPEGCIGFEVADVTGKDDWTRALVLMNAQRGEVEFVIPPGQWEVFGDGHRISSRPLSNRHANSTARSATVAPTSALILGELRTARSSGREQE